LQVSGKKEKTQVGAFIKVKKNIKKSLLAKQLNKTMQQDDYSPFRRQIHKKGHFVFGMSDKPYDSKNK
jgi:hypothetical protein